MSHGRPTRRVRYRPALNMLGVVRNRAARLTPAELAGLLTPIDSCMRALREGVASELQWSTLASAVELSLAIEDQGVVRGLRGHFRNAEQALAGINRRAMQTGAWQATELYLQEIDDVGEAIRLHRYQLEQLSAGEISKAGQVAQTRVRQAGGTLLDARRLEGIL